MNRTVIQSLLFTLVFSTATIASANDWPTYHGVNRDRIVEQEGWSTDWQANPPEVLWRAKIGQGYSAVSVADGMAFTMGYDAEKGEDIVYGIDALTGDIVWTHRYACGPKDFMHLGGPAATPTIYDGKVYTLSKEAHLHCFDAETGDLVWKHDLTERIGTKIETCGEASSPLIVDGRLVVDAGVVAAFDPQSGDVIWQTERRESAYAAPIAFERDGRTLIACFPGSGVLVVDVADGEVYAEFPMDKTMRTVYTATPIVSSDSIFVSSNHRWGGIHLKFDENNELQKVWHNPEIQSVVTSPVLWKGRLIASVWKQNLLHSFDFDAGNLIWTAEGVAGGPFIIANEKLLAVSGNGELILADILDDGIDIKGRIQLFGGNCWTGPVLANGLIYCRNERGDLVCVDARVTRS